MNVAAKVTVAEAMLVSNALAEGWEEYVDEATGTNVRLNAPAWQRHATVCKGRPQRPALSVCVPIGRVHRRLLLPQQAAYVLSCVLSLHGNVFLYEKKAIGSTHLWRQNMSRQQSQHPNSQQSRQAH